MWKHSPILVFIVTIIFGVCIAGCIAEDSGPDGNNYDISATGTITYIDLEGGFYGIIDNDQNRYLPLNLGEEFQVDGTCVDFTANFTDAVTIYQWGTPIEIITIEQAEGCIPLTD